MTLPFSLVEIDLIFDILRLKLCETLCSINNYFYRIHRQRVMDPLSVTALAVGASSLALGLLSTLQFLQRLPREFDLRDPIIGEVQEISALLKALAEDASAEGGQPERVAAIRDSLELIMRSRKQFDEHRGPFSHRRRELSKLLEDLRTQRRVLERIVGDSSNDASKPSMTRMQPNHLQDLVIASLDAQKSTRQDHQSSDPFFHPQLLELHDDREEARVDVIFVHGLNGHPHATWQGASAFWPREFLPHDIGPCRILTFGYSTERLGATRDFSLKTIATDLLSALSRKRSASNSDRQILWVAHSLGGLIVKSALIQCYKNPPRDESSLSILKSTLGVLFFGTPHQSSSSSAWRMLYGSIASIAMGQPHSLSEPLGPIRVSDMESLEEGSSFKLLIDENGISIVSFFETKPMEAKGSTQKIVDEFTKLHHLREDVKFLEGNHNSMCKFHHPSEANYLVVVSAIKKLLSGASTSQISRETSLRFSDAENNLASGVIATGSEARTNEPDLEAINVSEQFSDFRRALDVPTTRKHALATTESDLCSWVVKEQTFKTWLDPSEQNILFITGPMGSGKSTIANYVVEYLQLLSIPQTAQKKHSVISIFFTSETVAGQTLYDILQSLVAQLLDQNRDLMRHVTRKVARKNLKQPVPTEDLLAIFRSMLEDSCHAGVYLVVDALDECECSLLTHITETLQSLILIPTLKFVVTLTNTNIMSEKWRKRTQDAEVLDLTTRDEYKHSINRFIDQRFKEMINSDENRRFDPNAKEIRAWITLQQKLARNPQISFEIVALAATGMTYLLKDWNPRLAKQIIYTSSPLDLPSLYRTLLERVDDPDSVIFPVLAFLACAHAPIRLEDLQLSLNLEYCPATLGKLLHAELGALIRKKDEGLQLSSAGFRNFFREMLKKDAHLAVRVRQRAREFLMSKKREPETAENSNGLEIMHLVIARASLAQLIERQASQNQAARSENIGVRSSPFLNYARKYWTEHLREAKQSASLVDGLVKEIFRLNQENQEAVDPKPSSELSSTALLKYLVKEQLTYNIMSIFGHASARPTKEGIRGDVRDETSITDVESTLETPTIRIDQSAAIGAQFESSDKTMDYARPSDLSEVLQLAVIRADLPTLKALKSLETEQSDRNLSFYTELFLAVKDGDENGLQRLLRNRPVTDTKVKEILLSTAVREKKGKILSILINSFDTKEVGEDSIQILDMAINVQHFDMVQLIMQNKHKYDLGKCLRLAAASANRQICTYLLAQGAQVNSHGSLGQTPLHIASENGELDLVKLLLEWRAVPEARDKKGRRPIHCAAEFGHTDIVAYLLKITSSAEDVDKKLRTPMFVACAAGWKATAELLIANGCNLLRRDVNSRTMLHAAAKKGSTQVVRLLIDAGCPVDEQDKKKKRPLHEAALQCWDMIVDELLQYGARVNKGDKKGETPLQYACRGKNVPDATVQKLLSKGADPNRPAKGGHTALHIAAKHSNAGVLMLLLDHGANINAQDLDGQTPLHYACRAETNLEPNFSTLLRFGAYPDVRDQTGKTPVDYVTSPKLRKKIDGIIRATRTEPVQSPIAAQPMELTTSESEEDRKD